MALNKKKPLSDEEVLTLVDSQVKEGVGWFDSRLSRERQRVIDYYNGKLPRRQSEGRSSYVSTDVYDSVESMVSQLLETFAGNPDGLISFPAQGPEDAAPAKSATEYTNYQIHRLNNGYDLFSHVIRDGLQARVGICKVFWERSEDEIEEEFNGIPETDALALAQHPDTKEFNGEETEPGSGIYHGTRTRKVNTSKVALVPVPPEEFIMSPRATSILKAAMCAHRTLKTKADLIEEGYDKDKVEEINWDDAKSLELGPEVLARNSPVETAQALDNPIQPEMQKVMVYESYVRMDMKDGKGVRLWKICHAGMILLDKEEVDRAPFMAFVPLPVSHMFWGNNFAARVIPYQNARTVLTRAILDHASISTNPRWGVLRGGLLNPKEMLDNRLGGIVNFNRPDAVKPLEQQNLNPFVFQLDATLKDNKEQSTGISSLSQGLNKDAVSNQNSQGLVQDLVNLSQGRQKIVARNFAYNFLIPLYLEVYRLVLENESEQKIIEVTGGFERISTEDWIERTQCKVALHLGYGERDKQSMKYAGLYDRLAKDPALAPGFGYEQRYELAMDGIKADGSFDNYMKYLKPPNQVQPPPPPPEVMQKDKEIATKDKVATAALITAQSAALNKEKQVQVAVAKEVLNERKLDADIQSNAHEQHRQDIDVANRIDISQREMALAEAAPAEATNTVVSPNN